MSVYGSFMSAFSELYKWFDVYTISPIVEAGFNVTFEKRIRGIMITSTRDRLVQRHDLTQIGVSHTLYTTEELHLKNKALFYKGKWYRAIADGTWNDEGGFCITQFAQIVGNVIKEEETSTSEQVVEGDF